MTLEVSVDELDINSVEIGQEQQLPLMLLKTRNLPVKLQR